MQKNYSNERAHEKQRAKRQGSECEREREQQVQRAAVVNIWRVSDATKNACLPFLFCGRLFFSFTLYLFTFLFTILVFGAPFFVNVQVAIFLHFFTDCTG